MPLLGCIADDYTGATDLANTLVSEGMRVVQVFGVPPADFRIPETDALIVALKTRSIPAADAVSQSLESLDWLKSQGAKRFLFKYCSTFDSTPEGNIGPVASGLMEALGVSQTIACPAFPENGRTVSQGFLFVYDKLLSQSGMENHPLNPMTDSNLVNWLQLQTKDLVDLIPLPVVREGIEEIRSAFDGNSEGKRIFIVDAESDEDLRSIGAALSDLPLLTGGSGVAMGLPDAYREQGHLPEIPVTPTLPNADGQEAILAGSCSSMTLKQIAYMRERCPSRQILKENLSDIPALTEEILQWADGRLENGPVMIYSSADPETIKATQTEGDAIDVGLKFEEAFAEISKALVAAGVRKLVVAGGETSGAVVNALRIPGIRIGPQIDPGVPWVESLSEPHLALALKSGNFGEETFFEKSLNLLRTN